MPRYEHVAVPLPEQKARREEGFTTYAAHEGTAYMQRPAPEAMPETPEAETPAVSGLATQGAEVVSGADLGDAIGGRAIRAFHEAGFDTASDILALPPERLAAIPGIGPATITALDSLR